MIREPYRENGLLVTPLDDDNVMLEGEVNGVTVKAVVVTGERPDSYTLTGNMMVRPNEVVFEARIINIVGDTIAVAHRTESFANSGPADALAIALAADREERAEEVPLVATPPLRGSGSSEIKATSAADERQRIADLGFDFKRGDMGTPLEQGEKTVSEYVAIDVESLTILLEKAEDYADLLEANPKYSNPSGRHRQAMTEAERTLGGSHTGAVVYVHLGNAPWPADQAEPDPSVMCLGAPEAVASVQQALHGNDTTAVVRLNREGLRAFLDQYNALEFESREITPEQALVYEALTDAAEEHT